MKSNLKNIINSAESGSIDKAVASGDKAKEIAASLGVNEDAVSGYIKASKLKAPKKED